MLPPVLLGEAVAPAPGYHGVLQEEVAALPARAVQKINANEREETSTVPLGFYGAWNVILLGIACAVVEGADVIDTTL